MKRLLFIFALALLLGAFFISFISEHGSGYVLIAFGNTSIETSLLVAILLLIAVGFILQFLFRSSSRIKIFIRDQKAAKQQKLTRKGVMAFSEGEWDSAMHSLLKASPDSGTSFANYLMAARAANENGNWEKAQLILQKAKDNDPKAETAIEITRAELLINNGCWAEAGTLLETLREVQPRQRIVASLLRTVYQQTAQWQKLLELLDTLEHSRTINKPLLGQWRQQTLEALLGDAGNVPSEEHPLQVLQACWNSLPKSSRENGLLLKSYIKGLANAGAEDQAEVLIRKQLKKAWDEELALLYGQIRGTDPEQQLSTAEVWLKSHPDSSALMLTLGRLAIRNKQWEQARLHLEKSLSLKSNTQASLELGRLLIATRDLEKGRKLLDQGLEDQIGLKPLPPMP